MYILFYRLYYIINAVFYDIDFHFIRIDIFDDNFLLIHTDKSMYQFKGNQTDFL